MTSTTKTAALPHFLVRLDRSSGTRLSDDDYYDVGTWGVPGEDYDIDEFAVLMVRDGCRDAAIELMERDDGVIAYEPCA